LAGAEKINVNSAAVSRPELINECAESIGNQNVVLSMDIRRVSVNPEQPSGYEIVINGGRTATGKDALAWALEGERRGAGELVINSIDADGTKDGYEITLTSMIAEAVRVPVIASGGAGLPEHLHQVLTEGGADAALVASMVHYGDYTVSALKQYLHEAGLKIRMC
jgi:cyclase